MSQPQAPTVAPDGTPQPIAPSISLYDQDFYLWTQTMAEALRSGNFTQLDLENLVEEVDALGRRDRRELESRLSILLMHLLKWQFQPEMRSGSWRGTLAEQRLRITKLLKESPSLRSPFEQLLPASYADARLLTSEETGLAIATFPERCSYELTQILDTAYLPPAAPRN